MGIKTVINLQSGVYEATHNDEYERDLASDYDMVEIDMQLSDWFPPDKWDVQKFFKILAYSDGAVYVHCLHGVDRTGYMCAAYQMVFSGMSFKDAVKEMYQMGFHRFPYFWWTKSLKIYEAKK